MRAVPHLWVGRATFPAPPETVWSERGCVWLLFCVSVCVGHGHRLHGMLWLRGGGDPEIRASPRCLLPQPPGVEGFMHGGEVSRHIAGDQ